MRPLVGFDEPAYALPGRLEMQDDWDEVGEPERPRPGGRRRRLTPEERRVLDEASRNLRRH